MSRGVSEYGGKHPLLCFGQELFLQFYDAKEKAYSYERQGNINLGPYTGSLFKRCSLSRDCLFLQIKRQVSGKVRGKCGQCLYLFAYPSKVHRLFPPRLCDLALTLDLLRLFDLLLVLTQDFFVLCFQLLNKGLAHAT